MAETKITKNMAIPCIDIGNTDEPVWARIDKSTVFEIVMNAETESQDYISQELPTEEIKNFAPSMDQEIATYANNPIYEYMFQKFYEAKTVQLKTLICFPPHGDPEVKQAWMVPITTCVLNNMNYVDGKLSWNMSFGGNTERGTYTIDESTGKPTFSKAAS